MNAAELRSLGERLNTLAEGYGPFTISDQLREAAEVLELIAWAEENKVDVQRGNYFWWSRSLEDGHAGEKTLVELLRRAREAAR